MKNWDLIHSNIVSRTCSNYFPHLSKILAGKVYQIARFLTKKNKLISTHVNAHCHHFGTGPDVPRALVFKLYVLTFFFCSKLQVPDLVSLQVLQKRIPLSNQHFTQLTGFHPTFEILIQPHLGPWKRSKHIIVLARVVQPTIPLLAIGATSGYLK